MLKGIISIILILGTLLLCSCSVLGSRTEMLNIANDEGKANAKFEQVFNALKNKDKDALKSLFSKKAVNDSSNFDGELNHLFKFIQGEITSWEDSGSGPTVFESNNHGGETKEVSSYYYFITNKQKYFITLRDYPVDTDNSDNVGLYMILFVKVEDKEKIYDGKNKIIYDGKKKLSHPGIYIPID